MRIDGGLMGDLTESGRQAKRLEGLGYNGVLTAETAHDPFFSSAAGSAGNGIHRVDDLDCGGVFKDADESGQYWARSQ